MFDVILLVDSMLIYFFFSLFLTALIHRRLRSLISAVNETIEQDTYDTDKKEIFKNLLSNKVYTNGLLYFLYPVFGIFIILLNFLSKPKKNNSLLKLNDEERYLYANIKILPIMKSPLCLTLMCLIVAFHTFVLIIKSLLLQTQYTKSHNNNNVTYFELFSSRMRFL